MNTGQQAIRVLGVDGGGSKTIAWIANVLPSNESGRLELEVIGRGHAGPSNPRSIGFELAFANLEIAIRTATEQASVDKSTIDVACLSLAGAGRREEQLRVQQWGDERGIAKRTIAIDDVAPLSFAAMYEQSMSAVSDGASWEQSITLVVGTGSIARGSARGGTSARCGGWGYLLGDEGSGFAIGLAGLRAVCDAHDRSQTLTPFQLELLRHLGLSVPTELVGFMYQSPLPRVQVAELSGIVLAHANQDLEAIRIVRDAIGSMVQLVETIALRLGHANGTYALALTGGILSNNPLIVERLLSELQLRETAPSTYHLVREPVYGALAFAADSLRSHSRQE